MAGTHKPRQFCDRCHSSPNLDTTRRCLFECVDRTSARVSTVPPDVSTGEKCQRGLERQEEAVGAAHKRLKLVFAIESCCRIINGIGTDRVDANRRRGDAGDCVSQKHGANVLSTKDKIATQPPDENGWDAGVSRQLSRHAGSQLSQRNAVRGQRVKTRNFPARLLDQHKASGIAAPYVL